MIVVVVCSLTKFAKPAPWFNLERLRFLSRWNNNKKTTECERYCDWSSSL